MLVGDDADAFNEMLKRQSDVVNKDARVLRSYVLRHYWGADSRDLVIVTEFDAAGDMFAFFDQFGTMMEGAFSEEQMKEDTDLWNKYVGQHADEVYQVTEGTRK